MDELLAVAESVVKNALASGAQEAEAFWSRGASMDVDIEADEISGANASRTFGGSVRLIHDGRLGFAYFSSEEAAPSAVAKAIELSRLAPARDYHLPEATAVEPLPSQWDDAIAGLDDAVAIQMAKDLVDGVSDCKGASVAGGGTALSWGEAAIVNSHGVAAAHRATSMSAGAGVALEDGNSSINAWDTAETHTGSVDASSLGRSIAETVDALRAPTDPRGGQADVLFLPDAGGSLLSAGVLPAIDGDAAARGRSVWSDSIGKTVGNEGLNLIDDPRHPDGIGTTAFDGEGMAARRTPLIENGVLKTFIYDSWDAHQHGKISTHHAVRSGFKTPPTTGVHHTVVSHENTRSLDALIGDIDRGFLVESILGAHTANATTGDFSVTAPNVWHIEGGALAGASNAIAIGGNLPKLLQHADGASDDPVRRDGSIMPALRFRDVAISA